MKSKITKSPLWRLAVSFCAMYVIYSSLLRGSSSHFSTLRYAIMIVALAITGITAVVALIQIGFFLYNRKKAGGNQ
ncbi:hypothetical protein [Filimonas effusa]|uniref:Uncharacterized protein n=1 Tax=Filimonas effusa TaxID=2508721 RepID=A0A4Q1D909_9BACT|nr:hypothetical protein [Filimonas effusa]RXK85700.1 hypothetical protein ESB13_02475 [Filimonas effusa]